MNLPDLTALNSTLETIAPHVRMSVSVRLDSDSMDGQQIEEAIEWFLDGGTLESHWTAWDKKTGFRAWELKKGFLTMYLGSSDSNRKERKPRRGDWMAHAMGSLVQDAVEKTRTAERKRLEESGRTFFQADNSLLAEVQKRLARG